MANGYVNLKLTGERAVDTGHAGLCLLAAIEDGRWSPELATCGASRGDGCRRSANPPRSSAR